MKWAPNTVAIEGVARSTPDDRRSIPQAHTRHLQPRILNSPFAASHVEPQLTVLRRYHSPRGAVRIKLRLRCVRSRLSGPPYSVPLRILRFLSFSGK